PERFGRGQIDDEIEPSRLLDWDIGRLRPSQDSVDIVRRAPVEAWEVRRIRDETSRFDHFAVGVHCGQPRGEREAMDPNLVGVGERFTNNIKGLRATLK